LRLVVAHSSPAVADGLAAVLAVRLDAEEVLTVHDRVNCYRVVAGTAGVEVVVLEAGLAAGQESLVCGRLSDLGVALVVLTDADCRSHLPLLAAGARGITPAADGVSGVVAAVETVLRGETFVPSHLLGAVLSEVVLQQRVVTSHGSLIQRLSPREREVLGLLGEGADHMKIAATLTISPNTAKTHINRLLAKLDVHSRVEAASLAIAMGITTIDDGELV
jgi:DNA-binding NarL/FixJ family response regulator